MSNESWVPDYLPDFSNKDIEIVVCSSRTAKQITNFAAENNIKPVEVLRTLIKFGLIVEKSEKDNSDYKLIERDNQDFTEKKVSIPLKGKGRLRLYKFGPLTMSIDSEGFSASIGEMPMKMKVPGLLGDELMVIANRLHVSIDYIMESVLRTGINAVRSSHDGKKTYIIREKNGSDKKLRFFGSD